MPDGEISDFVLEFLQRLVPHANGPRREEEAEELVSFSPGREVSLLGTELQAELEFNHARDDSQSLLRLQGGDGYDDKVIGIPDEPEAGLVESPVQLIEDNVGEQWRDHPSHAKDNFEFDVAIGYVRGERLREK